MDSDNSGASVMVFFLLIAVPYLLYWLVKREYLKNKKLMQDLPKKKDGEDGIAKSISYYDNNGKVVKIKYYSKDGSLLKEYTYP
ncbi:MAG: hypothetical protein NTY16_11220 [Deltaproteobacteria bacterium]|nr:hypothetical protein [Deltaproteobacteria bacterium]